MNSLHGADNGNDQLTQHQLDMNQQHFMEQQMLESQRASMQQAMFRPPNMQEQNPMIQQFWQEQQRIMETGEVDLRKHELPLARIKKVMKTDDDVRTKMMISAEAPALFAKACEIFVLELTMRAWVHTEDHKRRTLQRSDIIQAIQKTDMYDFLIDIVPKDNSVPKPSRSDQLYQGAPFSPTFNGTQEQALAYQQQQQMQYNKMAEQDKFIQQLGEANSIQQNEH